MSYSHCPNCKFDFNKSTNIKKNEKKCSFMCNGYELCIKYLLSKEFEKYLETVNTHTCINEKFIYLSILSKCSNLELFISIFDYLGSDKLLYYEDDYSPLSQAMIKGNLDICQYIYDLQPGQLTIYDPKKCGNQFIIH